MKTKILIIGDIASPTAFSLANNVKHQLLSKLPEEEIKIEDLPNYKKSIVPEVFELKDLEYQDMPTKSVEEHTPFYKNIKCKPKYKRKK